jgi:hypothetical protein
MSRGSNLYACAPEVENHWVDCDDLELFGPDDVGAGAGEVETRVYVGSEMDLTNGDEVGPLCGGPDVFEGVFRCLGPNHPAASMGVSYLYQPFWHLLGFAEDPGVGFVGGVPCVIWTGGAFRGAGEP